MITVKKNAIRSRFRRNAEVCVKVLDLFSLLSNKIRFRIVCALREGDLSVSELVHVVECGKQSNISQQLKLLTASGLLTRNRDRKNQIYHLNDHRMDKLIGYLEKKFL